MSRDRFHQIWACFHYVDVTPFTQAEIKIKNSIDGFWRVAHFVESLAETSSHLCRALRVGTGVAATTVLSLKSGILKLSP